MDAGYHIKNFIMQICYGIFLYRLGYYGLPKRHGKINELNKFDASFFAINPKQVNMMDPQLRILLEVVYEAILDAGKIDCAFNVTNFVVIFGNF